MLRGIFVQRALDRHPGQRERPSGPADGPPGRVFLRDMAPETAVTTRRRVFDWLPNSEAVAGAGHYPAPGCGHIVRDDGAFAWLARG
jgi:hypothetical protein